MKISLIHIVRVSCVDQVLHNVLRMIAEGAAEEISDEENIGQYAVDTYIELLEKPVLPDVMLRVCSFVRKHVRMVYGQNSACAIGWQL